MFEKIVSFIKNYYGNPDGVIQLHEPRFVGNDRKYVLDAIDSTYVSSVGKYVDRFEEMIRDYTSTKFAIATVNGTAALHMSLLLAGVKKDELVITQPLSFVATCNAISYVGADPLFVDVDMHTLGLSANKLEVFLKEKTEIKNGNCYHKKSNKKISACVPMHTFGHPVEIDKIVELCNLYFIPVIEDAAESIGSKYKNKHTGTFGLLGVFSFNGNKTITTGGGGMIITNDVALAKRAKHITTTAKVPHAWNFFHDEVGFNFRLPNLNAALGCAQMENLPKFLENKRSLALAYQKFFGLINVEFVKEREGTVSNYWLNSIILKNREERDQFLTYTNSHGVMTRPIWTLMNKLPMYQHCQSSSLETAHWLEDRVVNIPSTPRL